jgi:hypothetical protein
MKLIPVWMVIYLMSCHSGGSKPESIANAIAENDTAVLTADVSKSPNLNADFICKLNNQEWRGNGFFSSNLYYSKGMKEMFDNKPFLTLSFQSILLPDDRQLMINIIEFSKETKIYHTPSLEITLTGSPTGDPSSGEILGNRKRQPWSESKLIIESYTQTSADEIIITGSLTCKLNSIPSKYMNNLTIDLTEGKFTNVKVRVYNEKF